MLASQPWRARMGADFKVQRVLAPLTRSLAPGGRLLAIQSYGNDPGVEIVRQLWPDETPFKVDRHQLLATLRRELGRDARDYNLAALPDDKAVFRYEMHTLPSEIGDRIGTSTLFAAWNAAIYVNQVEDERLDEVVTTGAYLDATQTVLQRTADFGSTTRPSWSRVGEIDRCRWRRRDGDPSRGRATSAASSELLGELHAGELPVYIRVSVGGSSGQGRGSDLGCHSGRDSGPGSPLAGCGGDALQHRPRRPRRRDHSAAVVDYQAVARQTIRRIGYDNTDYGIDYRGCSVLVAYDKQSPDIAQGVDEGRGLDLEQGAGDQGLMFGYACTETPELMPLPIHLAHRLVQRQAEVRTSGRLPWLRPDAKSQVTVRYTGGRVTAIDTIVLSTQHGPDIDHRTLSDAVIEEIVKPVLPAELVDGSTRFLVNPTGRFVVGGPQGDCGLTGRKIIVDTYGGAAPHGGGAFSGKDPRRSTARRPTRRATSPRTSSRPGSRSGAWCRCRTRSESQSQPV